MSNDHGQRIAEQRAEQLRAARVKACLKRIAELSRELVDLPWWKPKRRIIKQIQFQLLLLKKNDS